jgi:L-asparagine oxygenase
MPRPATTSRFDLTPAERAAVRSVAHHLSYRSPRLIDEPEWLGHARRYGCRLPVRLLEELRQLRHDPGPDGMLMIGGLPIDEITMPPTPSGAGSVERVPRIPAAVAMLLGQQIGEVVAYRDEKMGALVQNVVPVPGLATSQSNAGSVPLEMHNENAFHPHRPDLIGLICLRSDHDQRAGTLVASIRRALPLLDAADVAILSAARFVTDAPPSFGGTAGNVPHPILHGSPLDPDIRVDFSATRALDDGAHTALLRLGEALSAVSSSVILRPGDAVFIDNRVVVHGRTDFTPRYDGRDRWLHRVYVHLDGRRAAAHRVGPGPVLS